MGLAEFEVSFDFGRIGRDCKVAVAYPEGRTGPRCLSTTAQFSQLWRLRSVNNSALAYLSGAHSPASVAGALARTPLSHPAEAVRSCSVVLMVSERSLPP